MFHADPIIQNEFSGSVQNFLPVRRQLQKFLSENLDVFAWSPTYMPGVDPSIICCKLFIRPEANPV